MDDSDKQALILLTILVIMGWAISACRKQGPWWKRLLCVTPLDIISSVLVVLFNVDKARGMSSQEMPFPIERHSPEKHPRRSAPCPCGSGKKYRECCRRTRRRG